MLFAAFGHIFLAYGLYYGVLVSDFTSYISLSRMFDGQRLKGADGRVSVAAGCCSLCDQLIDDSSNEMDGTSAPTGNVLKDIIKLQCGHSFHEVCMRGWVVVGKQEVRQPRQTHLIPLPLNVTSCRCVPRAASASAASKFC